MGRRHEAHAPSRRPTLPHRRHRGAGALRGGQGRGRDRHRAHRRQHARAGAPGVRRDQPRQPRAGPRRASRPRAHRPHRVPDRHGRGRADLDRGGARYDAVPVAYRGERTLLVAMADPANVVAMDDIAIMTGMEIRPAVASREDLQALIGRLGRMEDVVPDLVDGPEHEFSQAEVVDLRETVDDAPIIKLVNQIIAQAVEQGASDIHLEPEMDSMRVRLRIDGVLNEAQVVPRAMVAGVVEPHQGHGRAGHRRAARPAGRPRRAEHRRPPRRPPRGHPPERARRVGRHAHPRQGVGGHGPRPPWDGGGRPPPLRACDPRALRRGPRHRPDRLGQVDVALRGARRAQHAREEHRHDRGPGRVPARGRHPGAGQPARRPRLSPPACEP